MFITIHKIDMRDMDGNHSDTITTYLVSDNGQEFTVTCRSNHFGRSFSLAGKEGTLYIEREDNKVHLQTVALGGGCGLLIDDDPVEGLSPLAIHGIIIGENKKESREITITSEYQVDDHGQPTVLIDGNKADFLPYSDILGSSCTQR